MNNKYLSVLALSLMNVAIVMDIRGFTIIAREGMTLFFYLGFATLFVLLPIALVSAELATGWPKRGGVYLWVKEAFGPGMGFLAIWLLWAQNLVWYPTVLTFAASALSYFFVNPELAENPKFIVSVILIIFWGSTFLSCFGVRTASRFTSIGVLMGTIIPCFFLIGLGLYWWLSGNRIEFLEFQKPLIPDLSDFRSLAFLASIVLLYTGIEMNAVHIRKLERPRRHYTLSLIISMVIILLIFTFGSLTLAAVIPSSEISLSRGVLESFSVLLDKVHLGFLLPFISLFLVFGVTSSVITWINGPSRALLATAKDGRLPPFLRKTNKYGVQTRILLVQACIVTFICLTFVLIPNVSSAFFILTDLTAILYLLMYVLFYLSALRLRYTQPEVKRRYKVPGGMIGMWLVAGIGLAATLFSIFIGFFPPDQISVTTPGKYVAFLLIGTLIFTGIPWIIEWFRNPSWMTENE